MRYDRSYVFLPAELARELDQIETYILHGMTLEYFDPNAYDDLQSRADQIRRQSVTVQTATTQQLLDHIDYLMEKRGKAVSSPGSAAGKSAYIQDIDARIAVVQEELDNRLSSGMADNIKNTLRGDMAEKGNKATGEFWSYLDDSDNPVKKGE